MKIAVASDHRGFTVKDKIIRMINGMGHEAIDYGPGNAESVDYPEYASKVAKAITDKKIDRGILICGSGIGMCIVANKFDGVRAAPCHDDLTAEMSRLGDRLVNRMVEIWLSTDFEGGRHARRLERIAEIEKENHSGYQQGHSH